MWNDGTKIDLPGTSLRIASIDHLILMKRRRWEHMTSSEEPPEGSFEAAALWQLRMALKSTYAQRLQELQDMIDFNAAAEANNPQLRAAVKRLAQS